jgi:RHS repeat-associated protein
MRRRSVVVVMLCSSLLIIGVAAPLQSARASTRSGARSGDGRAARVVPRSLPSSLFAGVQAARRDGGVPRIPTASKAAVRQRIKALRLRLRSRPAPTSGSAGVAHPMFSSGTTGTIATVAGNGTQGNTGDGGPATSAELNSPVAVAIDSADRLDIASSSGIRRVDSAGTINTVPGSSTLSTRQFITVGPDGTVYGEDGYGYGRVKPDGSSTTVVWPNGQVGGGVLVDGRGDIYIAGVYGISELPAGNSFSSGPQVQLLSGTVCSMAFDAAGDIIFTGYTDDNTGSGYICAGIGKLTPDGDVQQIAAGFTHDLDGLVVDSDGTIFVSQTNNAAVDKLNADHTLTRVVGTGSSGYSGDGGAATSAQLSQPWGLAVDSEGDLLIADLQNEVVREVYGITAGAPDRPLTGPQPPPPPPTPPAGVPGAETFGFGSSDPGTSSGPSDGSSDLPASGVPAPADPCACAPADAGGPTGLHSRMRADPVNTATGAYSEQVTDAALTVFAGVPFAFTRTYTSLDTTAARLGPGWTDPYEVGLTFDGTTGDATLRAGDGARYVFTKNADGTFSTPAGSRSVLASVSGGYQVTTPNRHTYTFNSAGEVTAITDRHGQGLTFSYTGGLQTGITDAAGHAVALGYTGGLLTSVTLPDGRHVTYSYTSGLLTAVTDLAGQAWQYGYNGAGLLTTVTDPRGHDLVTNVYDASSGRVTQQTNAVGDVTHFAWNAATQTATTTEPDSGTWTDVYAGNVLVSSTDPDGDTTRYFYDEQLNTLAVQDALGTQTAMTYDSRGNVLTRRAPAPLRYLESWTYSGLNEVLTYTDGRGKTTTSTYNAAGDRLSRTTPAGNKTTWTYNTDGTIATMVSPRGNATGANRADFTTQYSYDARRQPSYVTDPLGNVTILGYDASGRRVSVIDPRGPASGHPGDFTTTFTYTARDAIQTAIDPLLNVTRYGYDEDGNLHTVTDANNHVTTFDYDNANRRTSVTDPLRHTTIYGYDYARRRTSVTDAVGDKTSYGYDKAGLLTTVTSPRGNVNGANAADYTTTYGYDADHRRTSSSHPLPGGATATTTSAYDVIGRVISLTDANGHVTRYEYDAAGDRTSVTDARGNVTSTSYTEDRQVDTVTDANTHATFYAYNADGQVASRTDANNRTTSYGYDHADRLTSVTAPGGLVTTLAYDEAGNLTSRSYSDSTPAVTYTFDADNRRLTMADGTGASHDQYDAVGQLTSVTNGTGSTLSYAYDAANRLSTLTYPATTAAPNGRPVSYGYDAAGRQTSVSDWLGNQTTYSYDAVGDITAIGYPNGVTATTTVDKAGRPTEIDDTRGSSTLADFAYGYDPTAQLTHASETLNGASTSADYGYTDANQLASDPTGNFTQDPANQLTGLPDGTAFAYEAAGQLASSTRASATTSYGYNSRGDRTSVTPPTGPATALGYNGADQLTSWSKGASSVGYGYDGDGLRASRTENSATTRYTWDPNGGLPNLIEEQPSSSHTWYAATDYIFGPDGLPVEQVGPARAISLVGATSQANSLADAAQGKPFNLSLPAGIQKDDQILLAITESTLDTATTPTGYTSVGTFGAANAGTRIQIFRRTATGDETTASVNYATGAYNPAQPKTLIAAVYRGADPTNPVDVSGGSNKNLDTSLATPVLTSHDDGELTVLVEGETANAQASTWTPPAFNQIRRNASSTLVSSQIADRSANVAGSQGGGTATASTIGNLATALLTLRRAAPPVVFLQHDRQGSTRLLTAVDGQQVGSYAYTAYGAVLAHSGVTAALGYNGQLTDATTGLQYLRARDYDPTSGQFLTRDPLVGITGQPYAYAGNSPTNEADPTGNDPCGAPGGGGGGCPDRLAPGCNEIGCRPPDYMSPEQSTQALLRGDIDACQFEKISDDSAAWDNLVLAFQLANIEKNRQDQQAAHMTLGSFIVGIGDRVAATVECTNAVGELMMGVADAGTGVFVMVTTSIETGGLGAVVGLGLEAYGSYEIVHGLHGMEHHCW